MSYLNLLRKHDSIAWLAFGFLAPVATAQAGADVSAPIFAGAPLLTPNSNPAAPLTARLQITANEPVRVQVFAVEATRSWRFSPSSELATSFDVPLVGFRPGRPHRLTISIRDAAGNRTVWPAGLIFTTPALPANFPPLHVTSSVPRDMEPGFTLAAMRYSSPTVPGAGMYCVYLDASGQVVWFYEAVGSGAYDLVRLRNGNLMLNAGNRLAKEVDLFGNDVTQWWAARLGTAGAPPGAVMVDCDSFHHELHELPATESANFVALSTEMRALPNYPTSEVDPTQTTPTANVVGDVVVEFRRDGTVVRELKTFDILDPYRLCYNSLAGFFNPLYGGTTFDWSHGNSVEIDPTDDTWVISMRHQDAVVKVRRSDHSIVWIHGAHDRWNAPWTNYLLTPIGSRFEWNFHQHAAEMLAGGRMALFDNGNYRVIPPALAPPTSTWYSRAVRYEIDPLAMTTRQDWDFRDSPAFFSGFLGDVDTLPATGNVLITDGARVVPGQNKTFSRLVEVKQDASGTKVWEVIVNDPNAPAPNPYNWNMYRSARYTSPYTHL